MAKPYGIAKRDELYGRYKSRADKKGISFKLNKNEFENLTKNTCYYCGKPPEQLLGGGKYGSYLYNGIDRRDNNEGYEDWNVVTCCKACNYMKGTQPEDLFILRCIEIAKRFSDK